MDEHERVRSELPALAAGFLLADETALIQAHLRECPGCAREWEVWQRLLQALKRVPESRPSPARLSRLVALAQAGYQEVAERRWNRLVLMGLVLYGWALFVVVLPLLPTVVGWLGERLVLPWFAVVCVGLGVWWSFCWVIGLGLLPLLRGQKVDLEGKVV
jgi:anti-sigma factor RsiW